LPPNTNGLELAELGANAGCTVSATPPNPPTPTHTSQLKFGVKLQMSSVSA